MVKTTFVSLLFIALAAILLLTPLTLAGLVITAPIAMLIGDIFPEKDLSKSFAHDNA